MWKKNISIKTWQAFNCPSLDHVRQLRYLPHWDFRSALVCRAFSPSLLAVHTDNLFLNRCDICRLFMKLQFIYLFFSFFARYTRTKTFHESSMYSSKTQNKQKTQDTIYNLPIACIRTEISSKTVLIYRRTGRIFCFVKLNRDSS